ncbi:MULTISPECIES: PTS sugar transporter subunit IIA [Lactiplantibacillus]|jgi:PTS system ascorbate-specific IIA component|uniref:Ascorbate-specific PTS system EIIA component n=1 Tax=Lactiplantibacillus pentosus TaxID=1589 RepID=A0ABX5D4L2_LACPE|nr:MULTISPECIES: PTS sugar transporter subunit IIA [Lactiplantibacillus]MBQ0834970.1 PTS sugar transporter subunit IIA [Lactiplantibacillus pentosus]MBU7464812.1 PTS sugar transporter subunit IIA [Lactiplantibacillus pentosus]MBU7490810.1 PTS sugar transporter subunit IIA [Lactiplantibacillus pentosus]MBU7492932.1 PTS sugar transporter subunit IIA [Lactiplantibacillus pentosus]MBU7502028.1 PTS sugar transporter subunit IIA [Lactiplantibacillus pentosus]
MLLDLLNVQTVQVVEGTDMDWQQAIKLAAEPLLSNKTIEKEYVSEMLNVVKSEGPYINIGPKIALAHSRPAGNVHKIGLSILKTNHSINLVNNDHPVNLWFVLAAVDNNSHLAVIKELMELLTDETAVADMLNATNESEILKIIAHEQELQK